jgi:hypothetical protein
MPKRSRTETACTVTVADLNKLLPQCEKELTSLLSKYGMMAKASKCQFNPCALTGTVTFELKLDNADAAARLLWNAHCGKYGFQEADFLRTIQVKDDVYQIVGLMNSRHKEPIILTKKTATNNTLGRCRVSPDQLRALLQIPLPTPCSTCHKVVTTGSTFQVGPDRLCNDCFSTFAGNGEMFETVKCTVCKLKLVKSSKHITFHLGQKIFRDRNNSLLTFKKHGSGDYRCCTCS